MVEKEIKQIINRFFEKMTWEEKPQGIKVEDKTVFLRLDTKNPEILIGRNGRVLSSLQYLLGRMISRRLGEKFFVDFDVNQYKEKKIEYITDLAKTLADKVSLTKEERALPPMPPFERRVVHLALTEREDVKTESQGEEPFRRIIIKPIIL